MVKMMLELMLCQHAAVRNPIVAHLPRFPAAAALLVVLSAVGVAEEAASGSSTGISVRGALLRLAAGFALVLGASG